MKKITITERALRELVIEALNDSTQGAIYAPDADGVKVNNVVDPSAAETDPMNPDFKPQNSTELGVAIRQMTLGMPDTDASKVYDKVKGAIKSTDPKDDDVNDVDNNHETEDDMDKAEQPSGTKSGTKPATTEAVLREMVRALVREDKGIIILNEEYEDYDAAVGDGDDDDDEKPAKPKVKNDENFDNIAKELGMGVSGAKQFVDKALARFQLLKQELPKGHSTAAGPQLGVNPRTGKEFTNLNDMEILMLRAWGDYIEFLQSTGELSAGDVQLMTDHPEVALDLPGFREYVHHYVQRTLVPTDDQGGEWTGNDPDTVDPISGETKPGKARTYQNAPAYRGDYDWLEDDEADVVKNKAASKLARKLKNAEDDDIDMDIHLGSYSDDPEEKALAAKAADKRKTA